MTDRSIVVRLEAAVSGYVRGMREAAQVTDAIPPSARKASSSFDDMAKSADKNRQEWDRAGTALTAFGTAALAGLALATKASIDWESAWTGVLKTVDGSPAQLDALEGSLRQMARTLPATHAEIAAVAEAAGQLGVKTADVAAFTRVMIDLGETTNLSADEAATSIAQLMNIMGTAPDQVDNLGAAIVELGNNGASTERDIVQMAQRIAGSAQIIGLTEGELLGIANALASVGIEADAGGTAISTVMTDMAKAVSTGSQELDQFAAVAGVSAEQFATAFKEDPADAVAMFVEGLGRLNESGGDVFTTLSDLGQADVRVSRALLSLAGAGDMLRESMEMGNDAMEENTALAIEAAKRYDTTASKVEMARGAFNDAMITIGDSFMPIVAQAAEAAAGLATAISNIPAPLLEAATGMGAVAGAASLAAGGFLLVFPRVMDTVAAFKLLNAQHPQLAAGLGAVGKAMGIVAVAAAAVEMGQLIGQAQVAQVEIQTLTEDLQALAAGAEDAGPALSELFSKGADWSPWADQVETADQAIQSFASSAREAMSDNFWEQLDQKMDIGGGEMAEFAAMTEQLDQAFASMVEGGQLDEATDLFDRFTAAAVEQGVPLEELAEMFPLYTAGADAAADSQNALSGQYEDTNREMMMQVTTLEELIDLQAESAGLVLSERDAQIQFEEAVRGVSEALETQIDELARQYEAAGMGTEAARARAEAEVAAADKLDITTEAGARNRAALDEIASAGWDLIESMEANDATQGQLQGTMATTRQRFLDAAAAMGMGSDEANRLADQLGLIPEEVDVDVAVATATAQSAVDSFITRNNGRVITFQGRVTEVHGSGGNLSNVGMATGGAVFGPGTSTSDSVPARLSVGEHVWTAAEVAAAGGHSEIYKMRRAIARYGRTAAARGFAEGGEVGRSAREMVWSSPAGTGAGASLQAPAVSLDGMRIVGRLDLGNGLHGMIDARVAASLGEQSRARQGTRSTEGPMR